MSYEFETVEAERMELRKQRDFGEKMNASFEFLKLNLTPFYRGILFIVCPLGILAGITASMISFQPADIFKAINDPGAMRDMQENLFGVEYFLTIALGLLGFIVLPAFVYPYIKKYLNNDEDFSVGTLFSITGKNFFPVLGAVLVIGLIVGGTVIIMSLIVGLLAQIAGVLAFFGGVAMFCVVMYLAVTLTMVLPIMIIEDQNLGSSISKSFYLIKDNWWSTFAILFVMNIVTSMISLVFNIPIFVVAGLIASNTLQDASFIAEISNIIANIIAQVGNYAIYPLYMIGLAFQYFNLTEKKDSTGLLSRIEGFGQGDSSEEEETY